MRTPRMLMPVLMAGVVTLLPVAGWASPLLKQIEQEFIQLSENLTPIVVEISVSGSMEQASMDQFEDLFRFFGQPEPDEEERPRRRQATSMGSGFLYDSGGHIITNNHVVEDADEIRVRLHDGSEHEAELVGTDPSADLAVIKIDPEGADLTVAKLGDSSTLKVGQYAIAMGSPRGLTDSVSFGHISALGRDELRLPDPELRFQNFIQTDAPINLGNSGGPLCNIDGEVIGVNVAIAYGANSIGFAIPIDMVKSVVPQLIRNGRMIRGWLGVSIVDVSEAAMAAEQEADVYMDAFNLPDETGAVVMDITRRGPAERAGLQVDDVIRRIDDNVITDKSKLVNTVSGYSPGDEVTLEIYREGQQKTLQATLGEFPDMQTARYGPAYLGLRVIDTPEEIRDALGLVEDAPEGVLVAQVVEDGPGEKAGFRPGDFIAKVAHKDVDSLDSFVDLLRDNATPGKTVLVTVLRQGGEPERLFLEVPDDFELP